MNKNEIYDCKSYDTENYNQRHNQVNQSAWLIYHWTGWDELPSDTIICTDKTEALEMFMSFVEEEMYITFAYMIPEEDPDTDWVWLAQNLSYYDGTLWNVMEVPIIHGDKNW